MQKEEHDTASVQTPSHGHHQTQLHFLANKGLPSPALCLKAVSVHLLVLQ